MEGQQTTIVNPASGQSKTFTFDDSMWSCESSDAHFHDQQYVYGSIGRMLVDDALVV